MGENKFMNQQITTYQCIEKLKKRIELEIPMDVVDQGICNALAYNLNVDGVPDKTKAALYDPEARYTLKDDPAIKYVLNVCNEILNSNIPIVKLDNTYGENTLIFGNGLTAQITGNSGNVYQAHLITDIFRVLTTDSEILSQAGSMAEGVSPLSVLAEVLDDDELKEKIEEFLDIDKVKPNKNFASVDEMLGYLSESTGFVIKYQDFLILVYEDAKTQNAIIKLSTEGGPFKEAGPTTLDFLFR